MKTDERGVLVVAGPLAGREMAFRAYLSRSGYAPRSARELVRVMARASDWLGGRGLTVSELTPPRAAELEAALPGAGRLLRFLREAGEVPAPGSPGDAPLAAAVPAVAGWRLASLPRGLDAAVVSRLLGSCDRGTIVGRRDYAVLIMLARLGLRGAEVAALQLADVDWRGGEVAIRPEGQPGRAAAAARRGRRGGRCLPDRRQATVRRANCVLHR